MFQSFFAAALNNGTFLKLPVNLVSACWASGNPQTSGTSEETYLFVLVLLQDAGFGILTSVFISFPDINYGSSVLMSCSFPPLRACGVEGAMKERQQAQGADCVIELRSLFILSESIRLMQRSAGNCWLTCKCVFSQPLYKINCFYHARQHSGYQHAGVIHVKDVSTYNSAPYVSNVHV